MEVRWRENVHSWAVDAGFAFSVPTIACHQSLGLGYGLPKSLVLSFGTTTQAMQRAHPNGSSQTESM